jgi:hypothetical protein
MFATIQAAFASALLDPDQPVPQALMAHSGQRPVRRFAVYRNNVVTSLVGALRAKFPATARIVGEEFFAGMARVFVTTRPPRSRILHTYGDNFGDFIDEFPPAAELPWLADVARLEAARTRAYHAADAEPLSTAAFSGVEPDAVAGMRLTLHPSLAIVRSRHPVVTIWMMNAGEAELAPVDENQREDALILRPGMQVAVHKLPAGGAAFLLALASGATLAEAASCATADDPGFDLTTNLAGMIQSGAVTACTSAEGSIS